MKVLIFGGAGMLGHKAYQVFSRSLETFVTFRTPPGGGVFDEARTIVGVNVLEHDTVRGILARVRPDVVLNCVGIVKQLKEAKDRRLSIHINALFPHLLADACAETGSRLIHVSTDCVFSGRKGSYVESDTADAEDVYGRTKFLGEVTRDNVLTIRTSIIGHGLQQNHSLVDWFLQQRTTVKGYTRAIYTGFPTVVLCREFMKLMTEHSRLSGLYHFSSDTIAKYDLLTKIRKVYGLSTDIERFDGFACDRSLNSSAFRAATSISPPSWDSMVEEMHKDYIQSSWYRRNQ